MSDTFSSPSKQANSYASGANNITAQDVGQYENYVNNANANTRSAIAGLGANPYFSAMESTPSTVTYGASGPGTTQGNITATPSTPAPASAQVAQAATPTTQTPAANPFTNRVLPVTGPVTSGVRTAI